MFARHEAIRSVLLQATFLSSSVFLVGAMPPYARAQVVCSGTTSGGCVVGPEGLVSAIGNGANGANSNDTVVPGGTGDAGGVVTLTSPPPGGPPAVNAAVNGGNGGTGYNADGVSGSASHGGNAGNGGGITITNQGAITAPASSSYDAISAWSIGGTGGTGGAANFNNGAQPGGDGGNGGTITISNTGPIIVSGAETSGILAFALGGAGGLGGEGYWESILKILYPSGQSGNGGAGGSASVSNWASITTEGTNDNGIYLATTGGAGGNGVGYQNGGAINSFAGNGGGAGGAATLTGDVASWQPQIASQASAAVQNYGNITTNNASGIWIWAVGGAGGNVGWQSTAQGGAAGNGGTAYAYNAGNIVVSGDWANGVAVTASGGLGGQGGYHSASGTVGGAGGNGGNGGLVTIVDEANNSISATGSHTTGLVGVSNGGGGGAAGYANGNSAAGGNGGNGGLVFISSSAAITTNGNYSGGIVALAVGGDGAPEIYTVTQGGSNGGNGGVLSVSSAGTITTSGNSASAIFLNAGGGAGSNGKNGGTGGNGGVLSASSAGTITTSGDNASAIFLNAGGGAGGYGENGGNAGNGGTAKLDAQGSITIDGTQSSGIAVFTMGGVGGGSGEDPDGNRGASGAGGTGGKVTVTNQATITGSGAQETGILINTSGGTVGTQSPLIWPQYAGSAGAVTLTSYGSIAMTNTAQNTGIAITAIGGSGAGSGCAQCIIGPSGGGSGNAVTAFIYGSVTTAGANASGAIAISTAGGNGGQGAEYSQVGSPEPVGAGGNGGAITITLSNSSHLSGPQTSPQIISTVGSNAPAIALNSGGGVGGLGEFLDESISQGFDYQGNGGAGGNAGNVTLTITGSNTQIITQGASSPGISVSANGGAGGAGDGGLTVNDVGMGDGGDGGSAGIVLVKSSAAITTSGTSSPGIAALSGGGVGGYSGLFHTGGAGGTGAAVGDVITVTNSGTIVTYGDQSDGIVIKSAGGNGGGTKGGTSGDNTGEPGDGAPSGNVQVANSGVIYTTGENSHGILSDTVGGGGGTSNTTEAAGLFIFAQGGAGGKGAKAGTTTITNNNVISTTGSASNGVFAFSTGGGGGDGGSVSSLTFGTAYVPAVSVAIGGNGGSGAKGGDVTITNNNGGDITTAGPDSAAIRALSVGGAGGFGGQSNASVFTAGIGEEAPSLDVTINIAGNGGSGGPGGAVSLTNLGTILTLGDQSPGLQAESIGGGGGDGGNALTHDYTLGTGSSVSIGVTMGGSGGTGGDGGAITLNNTNSQGIAAAITTLGFASDAVQLVSVGGGGGNGGTGKSQVKTVMPGEEALEYVPLALGDSFSFTATVGGNGGTGGNGGDIGDNGQAVNDYALTTYGSDARGIYALSVGGGGGTAAAGTGRSAQSMTLDIALGGNGGSGGYGGAVTIVNSPNGTITTAGDGSHGIFAQSIGGGGGSAGTATADIDGSEAESAASTASQYVLKEALSQIKSLSESDLLSDISPTIGVTMTYGGQGGAGGDGGAVTVTNNGAIKTGALGNGGGDFAVGVFAQSVGGGGGTGGAAIGSGARLLNSTTEVGGSGGAFGAGGAVVVDGTGSISTSGNIAFGVLAQSVGGGGGTAGEAPDKDQYNFGQSFLIGGAIADVDPQTATSGGGTVQVTTSSVSTAGNEAHGVVAQSIGGGGGLVYVNQANSTSLAVDTSTSQIAQQLAEQINAEYPGLMNELQAEFASMMAQSSGNIDLLLGGSQESSTQGQGDGSGGAVTVTNQGSISTTGVNALGVLAQSIGGGGGFFADGTGVDVAVMTASGTIGNISSGSVEQSGGAVNVVLAPASTITTKGNGATAIVAQSIGGGGGYTGALDATGVSYQTFLSQTNDVKMTVGANTEGGDVSITTDGSANITTSGVNAHGIVAQSLSGGGGLVGNAQGIIIPTGAAGVSRGANTSPSGFSPGTVSIDFAGTLQATGALSMAIFAQSGTQDSSGAIDRTLPMTTSGAINVTLGSDSTVIGGTGVYAITLDGGGNNTISVQDGANLSSASNLAISSGWGNNTLVNNGTITGDVVMGGIAGFQNGASGTYVSVGMNGYVSLGGTGLGGGTLLNEGMVDVAGVGTIGTLTIAGTFAQSVTGVYRADVKGTGSGTADLISATDVGPTVSGTVVANVVESVGPGDKFLILEQSADKPITPMPAATAGLSVVSAQQSGIQATWQPITTPDLLYISPTLTFAPNDLPLGDNERAYADHLQKTWDAGGSEQLGRVYAELFNLPSKTDYQKALSSATPAVLASASLSQAFVARDRLNAVQSCPEFDDQSGAGTLLVQRDCAWGRVGGGRTDFTPSNATGYTSNQMTYAAGFQTEIAPDWFAGMSASYMTDTYSNTTGLSSSNGQGIDVTAVLKREMGQWLFSGALNLGYGWYDAQRWTAVGSKYYQSDSSYDVFTAATRLRADYEIPFQNWYLKPFGQLDLLYASTPGYDEGGHGSLYDLSVAGSDNFSVAIGPHLEVGGRVNFSDGSVLRPYASAGVTWFSNSAWQVSASLQGAPEAAGTFNTAVDAPDLLADVTLGLQWSMPHGIDVRVNYEANLGDNFTSQSGMARLSVNF